jgi:hypothetical protein
MLHPFLKSELTGAVDQGHSIIASGWSSKDGKMLDHVGDLSDKETQIIDDLHDSTKPS